MCLRPQASNPGQCLTMVKTRFNLNATAGVTGRSEKAFLSHVVIGQNHPFNGSPHSTRLSIYVQAGHETRVKRLKQFQLANCRDQDHIRKV